jgi:type III secretion HrpO family protein
MSGELGRWLAEALYLVLWVSAPALLVSLGVGLALALVQALTQVQEQTLSFVPKLAAVALSLAVTGSLVGAEVLRFTHALWTAIPELVR